MFIHAARGAYHPTAAGRAQLRHRFRTYTQARATRVCSVGDAPPPTAGSARCHPPAVGRPWGGPEPPRLPPRTRPAGRRLGLPTLAVPVPVSGQSQESPIDVYLSARYKKLHCLHLDDPCAHGALAVLVDLTVVSYAAMEEGLDLFDEPHDLRVLGPV